MIGMGILGKSGCLCLLRGEEALLFLSDLEQSELRVFVGIAHSTILQLF
jgi:hypothetical protein